MTHTTLSFPFRRHALALALALATGASSAATINVIGACTLVNAINNANADADTDGPGGCPAGSGADVLNLKANSTYTLTTVNNNTGGANGLPVISSAITINGNSATIQRSLTTGIPDFRLLHIASSGNLKLKALTLTGGKSPSTQFVSGLGDVGGILNQGVTTLINSTVSGNRGGFSITDDDSGAAGIQNQGSMSLVNSTVSRNFGLYTGGVKNEGDMTIAGSSITNNLVNYGFSSGIVNSGDMKLTNSNISNNGSSLGSAILNYASISLTNCTISDNDELAGIRGGSITLTNSTISGNYSSLLGYGNGLGGSSVTLTNSLIANSARPYSHDCTSSTITLQGVNFIADGSCGAPISGDPQLSALLDNGGITLTKALQTGSPAINAADSTLCPKTDQRNVKRPPPTFNACDIGAFERTKGIPASVTGIVQFFDTQVASGGVTGTDSGDLAPQQLDALRNQLLIAGHYKQQHLPLQSCAQLTRTLAYIDTDNTPETGDYVTGEEADALTDEINALRTSWSCK